MTKICIKNGLVINRGISKYQDVLIANGHIEKIEDQIDTPAKEINAEGQWVMPGLIDDQVHFREPGLTHKATIHSESRAALAGGVTSFMEMPNTKPQSLTQELLEEKYVTASRSAITNYSFFMGASNDNIEELLRTDRKKVCGVKVFMGSSTGDMLVDDEQILESIFSNIDILIATHCEDEETIRANMRLYQNLPNLHAGYHPIIRSREGCLKSSALAVSLAKNYGARLHVLHISTEDELFLFDPGPVKDKKITAEACVHHLFFNEEYYEELGNLIKCNPAIKGESDRKAIFDAVLEDRIDVIATDHAPHTWDEKHQDYLQSPSGLPLVEHSLSLMLSHYHNNQISKEKIVQKMSHSVADLFDISDRGYLDEGQKADVIICDPNLEHTITNEKVRYKCGWSPLHGKKLKGKVTHTFVNGILKYHNDQIIDDSPGERLVFDR